MFKGQAARPRKKSRQAFSHQTHAPKRFGRFFVFILFFAATYFFLAYASPADSASQVIAASALMFALAIAFAFHRFARLWERRQDDLLLLQQVLESSRGARLVTDEENRALYYNRKFESLCKPPGPPSLSALMDLFPDTSEGRGRFMFLIERAVQGQSSVVELCAGEAEDERCFSITVQPLEGTARGLVHWRVDDVTEMRIADRMIREEYQKSGELGDNAPVGFYAVDREGRFVFVNATFARWLGEDANILLTQKRLHDYVEALPASVKPYALSVKDEPRQALTLSMKDAKGRVFKTSVHQTLLNETAEGAGQARARAVVHDLTAEGEMSGALKAAEDKFKKFFEEAPIGIVQVNEKGLIEVFNSAFARMIGIGPEALQGQDLYDLVESDDRTQFMICMDLIQQGESLQAPFEIALKGGRARVATQMHARKFKHPGAIVVHFIDTTEQKALEAQFVQSQKMQAIGQLAGGIAHDFNNLLTAIIGFCDLLLLRHKPGDPSFFDIMQVKQNSNRAANLVRQLLAFSRQQTLRPRVQNLTDILIELSHLLRRLIGAGIHLNLVHGQDLSLVKVDEGQMEQVLINLAVNARDAMNGAGQLTIQSENFMNRAPVELLAEELPAGHWVRLTVTDTGCGISEDNLKRVFEPFFTTKEVGHGTGLGLATVYGIVRQTGGFLDVQSRENAGSRFIIYLPRANEPEDTGEKRAAPMEEDGPARDLTGTGRILMVEDEDAVRAFSQRALTNKGYKVFAAEGGLAALQLMARAETGPIDLLITDVVMPEMDGPALAEELRRRSPDLKIIFISGYTEDKLKEFMGPRTWFLPKPFSLKQLAEKVKEALGA